jgi:hypothetical protein
MKRRFSSLSLENLEPRDCPTVSINLLNDGHTLSISGNSADDLVQITQDDVLDRIAIAYSDSAAAGNSTLSTKEFKSSKINNIVINLGSGNNTLSYNLEFGADYLFAKRFTILSGAGNDVVSFDLANSFTYADGGGNSILPGDPTPTAHLNANLVLTVNTGWGADIVNVNLGQVNPQMRVAINSNLGWGNDEFRANLMGAIAKNAKVSVRADGGMGADSFFANLQSDLAQSALVDLAFHGGHGNDTTEITHYGLLDGRLNVRAWGGFGNDNITLYSQSRTGSAGQVSALINGESGNDSVTFNVWTLLGPGPQVVNTLLAGAAGQDTLRSNRDVSATGFEIKIPLVNLFG